MVTVFGILNLTEDSFFDESRRLDPAGAVTAAIEMLRVGSDVVDVGPAASHPDARPVSPADEIRRIAPLLDALSDQMHRVSIDSFQPETQRYALKRGVGYLNDIQGFPDPALYPDIAEADCRLVVMHSAQRDGIATRTGHLRPEDALDEIVRFFEARVSALRRSGVAADRLILDPGTLGHTGDEGPQVAMTGEARGCSRAAAPVCGFSRGTTARSVSLSWGGKEVGSPCEWRGGARLYSQVIVGESGLETC